MAQLRDGYDNDRESSSSERGSVGRADPKDFGVERNQSRDPRVERERREAQRESFGVRDIQRDKETQQRAITGMQRQGLVPKVDETGAITGADVGRAGRLTGFNTYERPTDTALAGLADAPIDTNNTYENVLSQRALAPSDLYSSGQRIGALTGGPAGAMIGTMVDAVRNRSALQNAGFEPEVAGAISGRNAATNIGVSAVTDAFGGGIVSEAAKKGYKLAGLEGATAAGTGAGQLLGAAGTSAKDSIMGSGNVANDVAMAANRQPADFTNDSDGPWFDRLAAQIGAQAPDQVATAQPQVGAIPAKTNYLDDAIAGSTLQYAQNADYRPKEVFSRGASGYASGVSFGNEPSSGASLPSMASGTRMLG